MYKQRLRAVSRNVTDARTWKKDSMVRENDAIRVIDEYTNAIKVLLFKNCDREVYNSIVHNLL